ncbi:MAG TPA: NAD(P)/FAD-dependent oxidoreductase [Terriglobales bacterium]|nr:NAD(P)/FAD-dependent oxidoreductase [Terriglobales bacterium]
MSRGRAMRRIWRTVRRQIDETDPGRPLFTRRDMLKASGMALGGLLLGRTSKAFAWRGLGIPRIGIVGAGIAGLTAALSLQDHGLPCSVYEASGRIGGRMHSNRTFWQDGQTSEWCGEFIDSVDVVMRNLASRFGLTLSDVVAAEPPGSVDTNYFRGGYYTDTELARDLKPVIPILAEQNRQIGPVVLYNRYNRAGYYFDHLSAHDWIEKYVPGGRKSRLGQYMDLATLTENGLDTVQQSSLNLIFPLDSDERYHIKNGNQQLPTLIAKSLPPGTIKRGWRMTAVVANSDQTVTLAFDTSAGTQSATFDYVILALPFSVLRGLDFSQAQFDTLKQRAIHKLGYGTNSKLVLQFDDRYWNGRGAWPGIGDGFIETNLPFQSTWDSSRAEPGPDGLLTDYTGGTEGTAFRPAGPYTTSKGSAITASYALRFLDQLEIVWPGVSAHYNGLATLSYPTSDPNLQGSYSTYKVGQYTAFAGYEPVPQGQIYFAGEHTSYNFQGFMEGGARSGIRAASEVIAAIG